MSDKISVLLVDDHALVRRGFRRMLDDDETLEVVATNARFLRTSEKEPRLAIRGTNKE